MKKYMMMAVVFAFSITGIAQSSTFYSGETPCGSNNCFAVIASSNIDNIAYFIDSPNTRVDFRNKSNPKNLYFKGDAETGKAILSILLTAKSTGQSVKIFVHSGTNDYAGNLPTQYDYATLVDP